MKEEHIFKLNRISFGIMIGMFIMLIIVLLCMYYPVKVATVESPAKVVNEVVKVGNPVVYELKYCGYRRTSTELQYELVDSVIYKLPSKKVISPIGCSDENISSIVIPKSIPPGDYTLKVTAVHDINLLHKDVVTWETEKFTVKNEYYYNEVIEK